MTTILDFQIRSTTSERYQLKVFERGQSQPLALAAFDYPLSCLTGFELNRLDSDGNDPVGRFERLQDFGRALHQRLFTADIQRIWQNTKSAVIFSYSACALRRRRAVWKPCPGRRCLTALSFLPPAVKPACHGCRSTCRPRRSYR